MHDALENFEMRESQGVRAVLHHGNSTLIT